MPCRAGWTFCGEVGGECPLIMDEKTERTFEAFSGRAVRSSISGKLFCFSAFVAVSVFRTGDA
jgi:hypothetical protein